MLSGVCEEQVRLLCDIFAEDEKKRGCGSDPFDTAACALAQIERLKSAGRLEVATCAPLDTRWIASKSARVNLWSWDLLQRLPSSRDGFDHQVVLRRFVSDECFAATRDAEEERLAVAWAATVLARLAELKLVEPVVGVQSEGSATQGSRRYRRRVFEPRGDDEAEAPTGNNAGGRLDVLNGDPLDSEGRGSGRRRVRARVACAVCTRLGWEHEYRSFWNAVEGHPCAFSGCRETVENRRGAFHEVCDAVAYRRRWSFDREGALCGI